MYPIVPTPLRARVFFRSPSRSNASGVDPGSPIGTTREGELTSSTLAASGRFAFFFSFLSSAAFSPRRVVRAADSRVRAFRRGLLSRTRARDSRINNRRAGDDERIMTSDAYYNSLSTVRFFFFFSLVRDGERNSAGTGRRERNDCNCINFRAGYSYRDVVAAPPRGNLFLHAEQKFRTSSQRYFRCLSDILWTFALFAFSSPLPPLPLVRKLRKQL